MSGIPYARQRQQREDEAMPLFMMVMFVLAIGVAWVVSVVLKWWDDRASEIAEKLHDKKQIQPKQQERRSERLAGKKMTNAPWRSKE